MKRRPTKHVYVCIRLHIDILNCPKMVECILRAYTQNGAGYFSESRAWGCVLDDPCHHTMQLAPPRCIWPEYAINSDYSEPTICIVCRAFRPESICDIATYRILDVRILIHLANFCIPMLRIMCVLEAYRYVQRSTHVSYNFPLYIINVLYFCIYIWGYSKRAKYEWYDDVHK